MERHETRLLAEREDLAGKVNRLARYLDDNKNAEHFEIMSEQLTYMTDYLNCLDKRIKVLNLKTTDVGEY